MKGEKVLLIYHWFLTINQCILIFGLSTILKKNIEQDGRYIIKFENLAPSESIQCEILSINREVPSILSIRSKECVAEPVNIVMQKSISNIALRCYQLLILLGTGTLTYLIIVILQWLVTKTG